MRAKSRGTDIASLIERFLDDNEENLPPVMFAEIEALADEIESMEKEKNEEMSDLNFRVEELEHELEELSNE